MGPKYEDLRVWSSLIIWFLNFVYRHTVEKILPDDSQKVQVVEKCEIVNGNENITKLTLFLEIKVSPLKRLSCWCWNLLRM